MRRILIATDGSGPATRAVETGLELAAEQGAEVTFLQVLPPEEWAARWGSLRSVVSPHRIAIDEAETALAAAADAAEAAGVSYALERISGETAEEILAVAEAKDVDLIVLGSRGRGPVTLAILGSVSLRVLTAAKRPVLVVKEVAAPVPA